MYKPTTALLSCFVQKPDLVQSAIDEGFHADMLSGEEVSIYQSLVKMIESKLEISFYTLALFVRNERGMSSEAGHIFEEMRKIDSAANYEVYLASVFKDYKTSILGTCGNIIASSIGNEDPSETIAGITSLLERASGIGGGTSFSVRQAVERAEKDWEEALGRGYVGIPSSIPELTARLGGYREGTVTILGGYRGEGKSTLCRQELSYSIQSFPCAHFPLEETGDQVVRLIAGYRTGISIDKLDRGKLTREEVSKVVSAMRGLEKDPLYVMDKETHIDRICSSIMRLSGKGVRLYSLDHIQRIEPMVMKGLSRNDTMSSHMSRLTNMIKRVGGSGLFLSQLSRTPESENRPPRLSDLRDSGAIEQDARAVLLLWYEKGVHKIKIAKNNNGESGAIISVRRVDGQHRFESCQNAP